MWKHFPPYFWFSLSIIRPGCAKHPNTPTPSKKRGNVKTSDEVINKVWECVRFNNGIMALLQLIQVALGISCLFCVILLFSRQRPRFLMLTPYGCLPARPWWG